MRSSRRLMRLVTGAAVATLLAGCSHKASPPPPPPPAPEEPDPEPMEPRGRIEADSTVMLKRNAYGGFDFRYSGTDVSPKGNFNLTEGRGRSKEVLLKFCLADENYENGVRFMQPGTEAIWIALTELLPPGASPSGPYSGDQFTGFATIMDGRCAQVVDQNDDHLIYTYALRFRVPGEKGPVAHDPIIRNGPSRHGKKKS